jgi:hypothetical protein
VKASRLIYALAAGALFVLPTAAFAHGYDNGDGQNWQQSNQQQNGDGSYNQRGGRAWHGQNNDGGDRNNRNRNNRWNRDGRTDDYRNYAAPQRDRDYRGNGYNGGYDAGNGYDNSGLKVIIRF